MHPAGISATHGKPHGNSVAVTFPELASLLTWFREYFLHVHNIQR
jgi:hypothetical protein